MKTLKEIFEKHSLYIQPEIAKRIKDSFEEWLNQQKVTTGADDSPRMYDTWIDELVRRLKK
jgi:hypothetical protein